MLLTIPIGWLVFYLVSKQFNPFSKPDDPSKRPRWFLALGLGLGVVFIYSMSLHSVSSSDTAGQFVVKTVFFTIYLVPILFGYIFYKYKVKNQSSPIRQEKKEPINKNASLLVPYLILGSIGLILIFSKSIVATVLGGVFIFSSLFYGLKAASECNDKESLDKETITKKPKER